MTQKTNDGDAQRIKRNAKKIKKEMGVPHHKALDLSAVEFGYSNFRNFLNNVRTPIRYSQNSVSELLPLPNPLTLPYKEFSNSNGSKRPNAKVPLALHKKMGSILKELHASLEYNKKGLNAIRFVKGTLDDWIQMEYPSKTELKDEEFFRIYYGDTDCPSDPWPTEKKKLDLEKLIDALKGLLKKAYHNCLPIRNLNTKLDLALKAIQNWPLNKFIKGLKQVDGHIPSGTLIYLKKHHRKPAIVLSHDTKNNLIHCYEDGGSAFVEREDVTVARKQTAAKKFQPMRLSLPYGKWFCENGKEILFNRDYLPIWMKDKAGKVHQIEPDTWVEDIVRSEFYFDDGSTPWKGDKYTFVTCKNILINWQVSHKNSLLLDALEESIKNGNAKNLKFRSKNKILN